VIDEGNCKILTKSRVQGSLSAHSCPRHGTDGSDSVAEALTADDRDLEIEGVGDSVIVRDGDD